MKLVARGRIISWPRRPLVMGIVNLGADSFSGDGIVEIPRAIDHARQLVSDGAEIIDVGAESARTNRAAMSEAAEAKQLCHFIKEWREPVMLSINTWRPAVARAALALGGEILNDISGLPQPENAAVCAETGARARDHAHSRRSQGRSYPRHL
jgi:dihydropteroate synthase